MAWATRLHQAGDYRRTDEKGARRMQRTKPYIGSNDQLDELAEQEAEWQRANHEAGECLEDCPYCELVRSISHDG